MCIVFVCQNQNSGQEMLLFYEKFNEDHSIHDMTANPVFGSDYSIRLNLQKKISLESS